MRTTNKFLSVTALLAASVLCGCGTGPTDTGSRVLPVDSAKVQGTWKVEAADTWNHSIVNHDQNFIHGTVGQEFVISADGFHFSYKNHWPFVACGQMASTCELVAPESSKPFVDHWTSPDLGNLPSKMYHVTSKCEGVFQDYFISDDFEEIVMNWDNVWMKAKRVK